MVSFIHPQINQYICLVNQAQIIALYQPTLYAIAYRMLGSIADAEDLVNDTFLKWLTIDTSKIRNTKAFLVRMLTNNCLNFLQGGKKRLTDEGLDVLEDQLLEEAMQDVETFTSEKEGQLATAWRILHRKLEPAEKAIYVLRELFNVDYEDIQHVVGKNADNCRKIFSRAKSKLNTEMPRINIDLSINMKLPKPFLEACHFGQLSDLITDLKADLMTKKKK